MPGQNFCDIIEQIVCRDFRYRRDAYTFMNEAIIYTIRKSNSPKRHVAGPELIHGAVELAQQQFGLLAWNVFQEWGLTTGTAIGDVVFNMIHAGLLTAGPTDSPEDFRTIGELHPLFRNSSDTERKHTAIPRII